MTFRERDTLHRYYAFTTLSNVIAAQIGLRLIGYTAHDDSSYLAAVLKVEIRGSVATTDSAVALVAPHARTVRK